MSVISQSAMHRFLLSGTTVLFSISYNYHMTIKTNKPCLNGVDITFSPSHYYTNSDYNSQAMQKGNIIL